MHEGDERRFQTKVPEMDETTQEYEMDYDYYTTPIEATDTFRALLVIGCLPLLVVFMIYTIVCLYTNTCREEDYDSKPCLPLEISENEALSLSDYTMHDNNANDEIHREVPPEIQLSSTLHEGDDQTEVPKDKVNELIQEEEEADYYTTPVEATDMSRVVLVTGCCLPLPPSMIKTSDKDSVACPSAPLLSGIKGPSSKNTGSVVYNFLSDEVVESALETSRYQWTPQDNGATPRAVSGKGRRSSRVKVRQPKDGKRREIKQPHAESSNDNKGKLVFITSMNTVNQPPVGCELVFQRPVRTVPEEDIEKEAYAVSRQCMDDGCCTVQREKGKQSGRQCMVWRGCPSLVQATPPDRSDATPPDYGLEGPPDTTTVCLLICDKEKII